MAGASRRTRACALLLLCLSEALRSASGGTGTSHYDTLRVGPTATAGQIKKAFRKLAVKYHPDKSRSADAEETFREIAEAYAVLSNKERRRLYDSVGHEAFVNNDMYVKDEDEDEDETSFHFRFSEFFHDSAFVEEQHFHWSSHPDWEDEDGPYDQYSSEGPDFSFYFRDWDDNEEKYDY